MPIPLKSVEGGTAQALSGATGTFGPFDMRQFRSVALDINVTVLAADSITFFFERQGAAGDWYPIYSPTALTAAGTITQAIGPALATNTLIGTNCRIRWVMTGATKTATVSYSLWGEAP